MRTRLLSWSELTALAFFGLAGILGLVGRQLYGDGAKAALYALVRTLPARTNPYALAAVILAAIVLGGFLLYRARLASPILYGGAEIAFAGFAGGEAVTSFARQILLQPDGPALDVAVLAALLGFCAALYVAVRGWDNLLRGLSNRRASAAVARPAPPGPPLAGLLTPSTMARSAAQLAFQLANYAAAEAATQEQLKAGRAATATAAASQAEQDAEAARTETTDWAAARTALAAAHLAVRKAAQG